MLEAEVHSELRAFLREQDKPSWPHHLTMARLVARALRLGRPALIETGTVPQKYCLSYLAPALLSPGSVVIVAPTEVQQLLLVEIPPLQRQLGTGKEIQVEDSWRGDRFEGVLLTTPQSWLADRLQNQGRFPRSVPTLIEGADHLEEWVRKSLEVSLRQGDWNQLILTHPDLAESIRNVLVQLTKALFSRPQNPYGCCLIEQPERDSLRSLLETLASELTGVMSDFWQQWQTNNHILWASLDREAGQFALHISPGSVAHAMQPIWAWQPVVLMGSFLDGEKEAPIYRHSLGLEEILTLKFSSDRQTEPIQLYLPDHLPMPNTPQFQGALFEQTRQLISLSPAKSIVLIVEDVPLKAQVGTTMASEFGSRVQVERLNLADNGVLVCGWKFWHTYQERLPTPQLLVVATLPLPSLENPLVAGRVAYYKRQHQDWFRLYLLPTALRELQRAVIPIRSAQGVVALLDNRVNHRSYGSKILNALEPYARINYLDSSWLM